MYTIDMYTIVYLLVFIMFILLIVGGSLALAARGKRPAARIAAMALGSLGGLIVAFSVYHYLTGPFIPPREYYLVAWGILSSLMGFAGGALALTRPGVAGTLMLVNGIGFIIAAAFKFPYPIGGPVSLFVPFPLITGGALALAARKKYPATRILAMVLGILAGLLGAFVAWRPIGEIVIWGLLCSLMAIVGGGITLAKPVVAGTLMLLSSIGCFSVSILVSILVAWSHWQEVLIMCYAIAGFLLIAGCVFAMAAPGKQPTARIVAMTLGVFAGLLVVPFGFFAVPFSLAILLIPLMAIAGGALALKRPAVAGALMALSSIGAFTFGFLVPLPVLMAPVGLAGLLLISGAVLALAARKKRARES